MRRRAGCILALVALSVPALAVPAPPPAVVVTPVEIRDVAPVQTFPGQVQAVQSVTLVARVTAFVEKVGFKEGSLVKAGQVLFQLQQGPYQAAVQQAQGALAQAEATLRNTQLNLERDQKAGSLAISAQQVQQDGAARDVAAGQVDAARGSLEAAAINLSYCTVAAPIDGRVGKALFTAGNLVGPTSGPLGTIVQVDPIRVSFAVTDAQLVGAEQKSGQSQSELTAAATLTLILSNGAAYPQPGKIEFVNNQVDAATGTLTIWGLFPNPDGLLIPGSYVSVEARRAKPEEKPVVPVQAVQSEKQGQFVLIVGDGNKVEQRRVTTGRQVGQDYIVEAGLSGGERVITEGVQKVHPGQVVSASAAEAQPGAAPGGPAAADAPAQDGR